MNNTFYCPNCGKDVDPDITIFCPECGIDLRPYINLKNNENANIKEPVPYIFEHHNNYDAIENKQAKKSYPMIIAGNVLSLIAFLLINPLMIFSILGLIFSSIGFSQAKADDNTKQKRSAIIGIVIGIISCIWFIFNFYNVLNNFGISF